MTVISSKSMIFSSLFYEGLFTVPWHQRRYDWEKDHVRDLLLDIKEAIKEDRKCYFLGSIMLVEKGKRNWEINDGQQRMMTFSLICARLCRLFHRQNTIQSPSAHETRALDILFDLGRNHTHNLSEADNFKPRLAPPRNDNDRYHSMIRGKDIGTNGKLTTAWQEIDDFISAMDMQNARNYFDFLIKKVEVACLYIPEDVDPNSVFETINCRGKHLEDLDLLRNHLYSYFNRDEESSRRNTVHDKLENALTQLRGSTQAADYVRCYFQCKYGYLPKARFYRGVRRNIGNNAVGYKKPADYIYDLVGEFTCKEWVELFRKISNPRTADSLVKQFVGHSGTATSKRNLSVFLRELQTYKVAQPMIFALLVHYVKEKDSTKKRHLAKAVHSCMNNITSFIMRTAFVAPKFEPSKVESEFSNLAKQILSYRSLDANCKASIMTTLKKSDSHYGILENGKFVERLTNMEMRDPKKAKCFLIGLNADMQTDGAIINEKECTVEHILPKSEVHWPGWSWFQGQKHGEWVHRIGNLTLLGANDNKSDGKSNGDFSRKKALLGRSALVLTKKIAAYNDWSGDAIVKRQKEMADRAARVWAFSK